MKSKIISIIMPCFNGEKTLSCSIESVLSQSFIAFELLIIDDNSNDNSYSIAKSYEAKDKRIVVVKNSIDSRGVSSARNIGLSIARGRYICFLDCDDYLLKDSLKIRYDFITSSEAAIVYGDYFRLYRDGSTKRVNSKEFVTCNDMFQRNYIANLTGMYDSQRVEKVYQKNIKHEDYLMWWELLSKCSGGWAITTIPLAVYRVSPESLSGNKFRSALWHWSVLRKGMQLNILKTIYYQSIYLFVSVIDRFKI